MVISQDVLTAYMLVRISRTMLKYIYIRQPTALLVFNRTIRLPIHDIFTYLLYLSGRPTIQLRPILLKSRNHSLPIPPHRSICKVIRKCCVFHLVTYLQMPW
jgi:hypothetical protein